MKIVNLPYLPVTAALVCGLFILQACSNNDDVDNGDGAATAGDTNDGSADDNTATPATFMVSAVNLTAGQPLSPPAIVLHGGDYRLFEVGMPASNALELLAEGGDNSMLTAETNSSEGVYASVAADAPIGPGGSAQWTISDTDAHSVRSLSLATMLVNTNDGFSGTNSLDLSSLDVGQVLQLKTVAYDSGTEANTEMAGTIPGPADGGEGFNAVRDDIADHVAMHSGVVSVVDGLDGSVLTSSHRFLNPIIQLTITRTE
jgi:hypothetical protein